MPLKLWAPTQHRQEGPASPALKDLLYLSASSNDKEFRGPNLLAWS